MKTFFILIALVIFVAILYKISCIIAKWMVKKRILLAKDFEIGNESPEKIEVMKRIAKETLSENMVPLELSKSEGCIVATSAKNGIISEVRVETEKTKVLVYSDGTETVIHKNHTEESAISIVAGDVALILYMATVFCMIGLILCFKV